MALTPAERLELVERIRCVGDLVNELARRADGLASALETAGEPTVPARPDARRDCERPGERP